MSAMTVEPPHRTGELVDQLAAGLVAVRSSRRLSRKRVAEAAGLAPNTLGEIEHGLANPTLRRVEELAELYGADVRLVVTPKEPTA